MKTIENADHVFEVVLSKKEIEKMIKQLERLNETKSTISLTFSDEKEIVIHHEEDELLKFKKERQFFKGFDVRAKTSTFLGRFSRKNKTKIK